MTKNIDARAEDGATALTELLIRGDFALAQLVIQSGASLHTISTLVCADILDLFSYLVLTLFIHRAATQHFFGL